jgi:hypothetical protein
VFDSRYKRKTAQQQIDMINKEYAPLYDKVSDLNMIVSCSRTRRLKVIAYLRVSVKIGEWACTNPNAKQDWNGQKAFCDAEVCTVELTPRSSSELTFATAAMIQMAMLSKPAIGGIHYWCKSGFGSNVLVVAS